MEDKKNYLLLDGATGTLLQKSGLKPGEKPEHINIEQPEMIADVYRQYEAVGSNIVMSNTFGANSLKLKDSPYSVEEVITAAIQVARHTVKPETLVALDIGPLGELMEPMGSLSFEKAYELYKEMILAGVNAGADLICFETMSDLLEVKAGVLAAKENCDLPVFVSMSFEANGRTFTGCTIESMGMTLTGLGVDALGLNCSVGPDKLYPLIERLAAVTDLPIIAKPNAGLPDPMDGHYDMDPESFLTYMKQCAAAGASILGGCCGTTPDYIARLKETFVNPEINPDVNSEINIPLSLSGARLKKLLDSMRGKKPEHSMVCTPLMPVIIDTVTPIGERINPTGKKRFQKALLDGDLDYIVSVALAQQEAGARILDVNVGFPGVDEEEMLWQVVKKLQSVVDLPLQLDSSNPRALEKALRIYNGKPAVNSINAKQATMDAMLPMIKKYGAATVGLTIDEAGIPDSWHKRVELAQKMQQELHKYDIPNSDLWIDPLCLTVSAQQDQARETLKAIQVITEKLHLNTVLGISNISFGLPLRPLITQTFLVQAMQEGLRLPILNPNQQLLMDSIAAFEVLEDLDHNASRYIEKYADVTLNPAPARNISPVSPTIRPSIVATAGSGCTCGNHPISTSSSNLTSVADHSGLHPEGPAAGASSIPDHERQSSDSDAVPSGLQLAVIRGLGHEAAAEARELLAFPDFRPLDLVEKELIPALDVVGSQYESGKMFLPQLLSAANAAQEVFEVLRTYMAEQGLEEKSKGKIILATVQGDVHDIGKNIVKTVLENYGFQVLDLGKDVAPQKVVDTVIAENVPLVGLSALMTTTLPAMEQTVKLLKALDNPPRIMVGGAVVTQAYADSIGADFYGKDASASAAYARKVFEA